MRVGISYGWWSQPALAPAHRDGDTGGMSEGNYCVIGAGAAGLAALQVLRDEGFAVDCFERSDRVGGHWHTDYDCLHLITPRGSSGFEGSPMPADYPLFPSRDQMRDYIVGFAADHDLGSHIRFNTEVTSVRPLDANGLAGWEVDDLRRPDARLRRRDRRQRSSLGSRSCPSIRGTSPGTSCIPAPTATPRDLARRAGARRRRRATPAATSPSTPRRPAARPSCRCATGSCSSPRRCSGARARSCRCSPASRSRCRSA